MAISLKLRPTSVEVIAGSGDNGGVLNRAYAIDADDDTPATYATLERNHFSGLSVPTVLYLSGFIPPVLTGTVDTIDLVAWAASTASTYTPFYRACRNLAGIAPNQSISGCTGGWSDFFSYHNSAGNALESHSFSLSLSQDLTKVVVQFKIIGTLFGNELCQFLIYDCYLHLQGDFLIGEYVCEISPDGVFPLKPDYSIPRRLTDLKVRVPLQNGNLNIRSQGADAIGLGLHGKAGYDELDTLMQFYEDHGDGVFHLFDGAYDPAIDRWMRFAAKPAWHEDEFNSVLWECMLQEVPH